VNGMIIRSLILLSLQEPVNAVLVEGKEQVRCGD